MWQAGLRRSISRCSRLKSPFPSSPPVSPPQAAPELRVLRPGGRAVEVRGVREALLPRLSVFHCPFLHILVVPLPASLSCCPIVLFCHRVLSHSYSLALPPHAWLSRHSRPKGPESHWNILRFLFSLRSPCLRAPHSRSPEPWAGSSWSQTK